MIAKRKIVYGQATTQPAPADPRLMSAFNFNEYDLHFNKRGDLSDRQFQELRQQRTFATLLLSAIASFPLLMWLGLRMDFPLLPQFIAFGAISLLICAPLFGVAWSFWSRYTHDMYDAPIFRATGEIDLDMRVTRNGAYLSMTIDGQQFKLNKAQFLAVKNRDIYTIYYTSNTKRLLSICHED